MSTSWPYKIGVRSPIQETVVAEDSVNSRLETLPLLPPSEMEGITRQILREHGFEDSPDDGGKGGGKMSRERDGIEVSIDPGTGTISARSEGSDGVEMEDEESGGGGGCTCQIRNKAAIAEANRNRKNDASRSIQEMVTGKLAGALAGIGCEMEQVSNQITARALKRRAGQLGEIKRISHDDRTGAMEIVVEV